MKENVVVPKRFSSQPIMQVNRIIIGNNEDENVNGMTTCFFKNAMKEKDLTMNNVVTHRGEPQLKQEVLQ